MEQNISRNQRGNIDPNQALSTLGNLGEKFMDLQNSMDTNKTEREKIRAEKEVTLKKIEAARDIILSFLDKSFDERATVFKKNFEAMDAAIQNNDMKALAITVQSVNYLAAQSPFAALLDAQKVRQSLIGNDTIEI